MIVENSIIIHCDLTITPLIYLNTVYVGSRVQILL